MKELERRRCAVGGEALYGDELAQIGMSRVGSSVRKVRF